MFPVTALEIEAAIQQYWSVSAAKNSDQQQAFYSPGAMIFTSSSKRIEQALLVSLQRKREYLSSSTKLRIRVSDVRVVPLGNDAAVAFYILQFHAEQIRIDGSVSKQGEEHLYNARVTQVFVRNENQELRIMHEHISVAQAQSCVSLATPQLQAAAKN